MWSLMLLLVVGDGEPQKVVLSQHTTRTACALAAHNERMKSWPANATVRIYWCREPQLPTSGA